MSTFMIKEKKCLYAFPITQIISATYHGGGGTIINWNVEDRITASVA
jgi:hypothetical protein